MYDELNITNIRLRYHYLIYQFGTEGHTQKARPVQGANPLLLARLPESRCWVSF